MKKHFSIYPLSIVGQIVPILSFIFLCLLTTNLFSQKVASGGQIVGIVSFGSNKYSDSIAAKNIRLAVSRVMTQTKRFTIIDIDTRDLAQAEIKTMKGEEFMERDIIQKGKSLGAQILAVGSVTNAEVYREGNKYASRVDYELKFIEVETGRSIAAAKFTGDSEDLVAKSGRFIDMASKGFKEVWYLTGKWKALVWSNAAAAALSESDRKDINGKVIDAIDESASRVNRWTRKTFDFGLEFIKVDEEDKNGAKYVVVEGGEELSMKEGDKLKMVLSTEIQTSKGKIVDNEPIAELTVIEIREQTVKCRVDEKGKKKVMENKDKNNMRIIFK